MKHAVVDIGSNTVKMNIYNADMTQVLYQSLPVGLINYVSDRIMSDIGIAKLIEVLAEYKQIARENHTDKIFYIATASLRNIDNQSEVLDILNKHHGINIEIISGDDEARYSYEGLKFYNKLEMATGIMIDMGGGSTEVVGFRDGKIGDIISLPFGCLMLYKKFVSGTLPTGTEIEDISKYIDTVTSAITWLGDYGDTVYLVGGTARSILKFDNALSNYVDITKLLNKIRSDLDLITDTIPDRINVIIPGIAAYCRLLYHMNTNNIVITQAGIREGYMMAKLLHGE